MNEERRPLPVRRGRNAERPVPDAEQVAALPPYPGLDLQGIILVADVAACDAARDTLLNARALGFDTESRPTFRRDQTNEGPHLVQFATADQAWLLPLHLSANVDLVVEVLGAPQVLKVGFGLAGDSSLLHRKLGARLAGVLDLNQRFRELGYRRAMGVKMAVALVLGQNFPKSKRVSTSDWSQWPLTDGQKIYAANDACAAFRVEERLSGSRGRRWEPSDAG